MKEDLRLSSEDVVVDVLVSGTCAHRILRNHSLLRKAAMKWVLHALTEYQKWMRVKSISLGSTSPGTCRETLTSMKPGCDVMCQC